MKLTLIGHNDLYAVEQLQLSLFPDHTEGETVSTMHRGNTWLTATTRITIGDQTVTASRRTKAAEETVRSRRRCLQQSYYLAAKQLLPVLPPWGALSGVRPTKITTKHILEGGNEKSADKLLQDVYFVTPERRALALDCTRSTVHAASLLEEKDISLYIGIPFCPTRCAYCSFVSRTVGKRTELIEPYLQALLKEIRITGQLVANSGCRVRTIYMGGGTPTTLSSQQMALLMDTVRESFDLSHLLEYTVEGGRPDTLNEEKLRIIRQHGADRMSINPQTMVDHVLKQSARPHTAADVLRAYGEAVDAGFDAINMDLIAGLPGDDYEGFRHSLDTVAALKPANITVHTLALKKDADLFQKRDNLPSAEEVTRMVDYASSVLRNLGYKPYYLYRQKYMSGSFENVGWSLPGKDCLYNIYMMEEVHTIVSVGGGSISKRNMPDGTLQRFPNPKFPEQYIEMINSVLDKKKEMFELMG